MACICRQHMFTNSLRRTPYYNGPTHSPQDFYVPDRALTKEEETLECEAEQSTENNVAANVIVNEGLGIRLGSHFARQGCNR